jgi:hypothetical protein
MSLLFALLVEAPLLLVVVEAKGEETEAEEKD